MVILISLYVFLLKVAQTMTMLSEKLLNMYIYSCLYFSVYLICFSHFNSYRTVEKGFMARLQNVCVEYILSTERKRTEHKSHNLEGCLFTAVINLF